MRRAPSATETLLLAVLKKPKTPPGFCAKVTVISFPGGLVSCKCAIPMLPTDWLGLVVFGGKCSRSQPSNEAPAVRNGIATLRPIGANICFTGCILRDHQEFFCTGIAAA